MGDYDVTLHFTKDASAAEAHLYLREAPMRQTFEAFLLAWRTLHGVCAPVLDEYGLGHAHHRILFLVGSHANITPTMLLSRLGITKQSLGRALGDLKEQGLLEQHQDPLDRRRKPICLTTAGRDVEARLFACVRDVMSTTYRQVEGRHVDGFRRVLGCMMAPEETSAIL